MENTNITLAFTGNKRLTNIHDYTRIGGFAAFRKVLSKKQDCVIEQIEKSKLRGRGGAGFPTGMKMRFTYNAKPEGNYQKYLICNADEGEPGTFKDRIIMEDNPYLLIEGMCIAAYAIGASKSYIYLRGEYAKSITAIQRAINEMYELGFLGSEILGTDFSLDMELKLGAGSYLCGEELTLLESLEGKRGNPRIKPPFPAEKGLYGKPTLVNNVETLSTLPAIVHNGADWFAKIGMADSPGTKIFTISGDVNKPGAYELPTGVSLRKLIYEYAGGIRNDKAFKGALLGGAAGTFVNDTLLDTPMSFDSLKEKGATLGSGAVIVFDETRSLKPLLKNILEFFKHESCGKCVPCRVGCIQLVNLIDELGVNGHSKEVMAQMQKHANYMAKTSLCFLGQSPKMPIDTSFKYFESDFTK